MPYEVASCSPDLNPIENLGSAMKQKIYRDGRQFSSKDALWDVILDAARAVTAAQILSFPGSDNKRLGTIISNVGS